MDQNFLQEDILTAIIKSKLNQNVKEKLETHCIYCPLENKLLIKVIN